MELIGWAGTTLVIAAYFPQIQHLIAKRCAWGISLWMWFMVLVSSILLLAYAVMRSETLFITVQSINILVIAAAIFLVQRSNTVCPHHLAKARSVAARAGRSNS
jgi:lipid-A-disaccharide synthase-like uncharacterized protein